MGAANQILGTEIVSDRQTSKLYLSQKGYIEKVLHSFNMQNVKPINALLASHFRLSSALSPQLDDDVDCMTRVPYFSAVGSLMYAMICSCLVLSRCQHDQQIFGYVDSDYTRYINKIRSLIGNVFTIGSCAISWKAFLHTTVALSTIETDYMVITEAFSEAIWSSDLVGEIVGEICGHLQITTIFCHSQSVIFLAKDQMFHERPKHIDIHYHFVCEVITRGDIIFSKINMQDNLVDKMTKALPPSKFK